jgi:hypothetical protein
MAAAGASASASGLAKNPCASIGLSGMLGYKESDSRSLSPSPCDRRNIAQDEQRLCGVLM